MTIVKSSAIRAVVYSRKFKTLVITFVSGAQYIYLGVTRWTRDLLVRAKSVGAFYSVHIRGLYPAFKI